MKRIRLGISTCPNDTFTFHGILASRSPSDVEFEVTLADVEELNQGIRAGRFDVAKASFATLLRLTDTWGVLPTGSAIGFGVGPVLLASREGVVPGMTAGDPPRPARVLLPGEGTTAALLYRLLHGDADALSHVVFHEIMPGVHSGVADLGVCIHEGRFTYQAAGLHLVEDLGASWERETGSPLPLGGIIARKDLGSDVLRQVNDAISASLCFARSDRDGAATTMRRYAQELDDDVIWRHVDLYVNEWTKDLGDVGARALDALSTRAREAGLLEASAAPIEIVGR